MATATPTSVTQYQTGFQPQLSPYEQTLAGSAMGTVFQYAKDANGNPILDPTTGLPQVSGFQQTPNQLYNPNQTYQGQQVAQFTPLEQQAFQNAQNMSVSGQTGQGSDIANKAAQMGLNANYQYNPYSAQNVSGAQGQSAQLGNAPSIGAASFNQPGNVSAQQISALNPNYFQMQAAQGVSGPSLQNYQMGPASQVGSQNFTGNAISQYMNPYLQSALAPQMQLLQQQQGMQQASNQARQTQAGAFGGARAGVEDALQNQSNQLAMSNLIGQGYNNAYNQAAQQFNTSNAANLQAQQANQQAGLTVGQQNLGANLQTQNLGATLGQQAQLANQANQQQTNLQNLSANLQTQGLQAQTGLQAQQSNQSAGLQAMLANQQMGYNTGLQNAQLSQQANLANQSLAGQYGLQQGTMNQQMGLQNLANTQQANLANQQMGLNAAQLNAQQQQFGAGFGLQGAQTALTGANTLGTLGQNQYTQNLGINQLQNATGVQQQQQIQNVLNTNYGNYMANAQYPQQQLGFLSNMYNSLPTTTQSTSTYTAPPSVASLLTGIGGVALGTALKAKGGVIKTKRMAKGGLTALAVSQIGRA